jgi:adenylate cyclase
MTEGKRRLAAILAADVVSYSAQIGADEPATLARVRALRGDVIEPMAAAHGGRLFKTMGDGFLLEFASAVQALRCAIAIQTAVNAEADGLRLRIGVHQGEVVAEGDDLFGDGVIVAARLEPLAEHGGIVISSNPGVSCPSGGDPGEAGFELAGQALRRRAGVYQHERRS